MITGLAHACFTVEDLDASIEFYVNKLGLGHAFDFVNDQQERFGVYLHVGGRSFIELFAGQVDDPQSKGSYRHLCLEVDDIRATVEVFRQAGVEVEPIKLGSDRSWQAWLTDPDGNRIELHQYTPESKQTPHLA
jgi:catechol 2,3-dioxygenase-like lactoylglutathione lyase family enzyme